MHNIYYQLYIYKCTEPRLIRFKWACCLIKGTLWMWPECIQRFLCIIINTYITSISKLWHTCNNISMIDDMHKSPCTFDASRHFLEIRDKLIILCYNFGNRVMIFWTSTLFFMFLKRSIHSHTKKKKILIMILLLLNSAKQQAAWLAAVVILRTDDL